MKKSIIGMLGILAIGSMTGCMRFRVVETVHLSDGSKVINANGYSTHVKFIEIQGAKYIIATGYHHTTILPIHCAE